MSNPKQLSNLPKECMWRVLGYVDETHRAHCAAVARRWSHFEKGRRNLRRISLASVHSANLGSAMSGRRRASAVRPMPKGLLVGLVLQFLDEPDDG